MSLFIGETNSTPIIHMTNQNETESTIKTTTPIPSTVFHSSLPYIRLKQVVEFYYNGTNPYGNSNPYQSVTRGYTATSSLPSNYKSLATVVVGTLDGVKYFFPTMGARSHSLYPDTMYGQAYTQVPSFGIVNTTTAFTATVNNGYFGQFSPLVYDKIEVYLFDPAPVINTPGSIYIDSDDIVVGDVSVSELKYVHFMNTYEDRLNDYDTILAIPNGGYSTLFVGGNYPHGTYRPNWVKQVGSTYTSQVSGGSHTYIQIINSASGAVNGVTLTEDKIAIRKDGVLRDHFNNNSTMYTQFSTTSNVTYVTAGSTYYSNGTYNRGTIAVTPGDFIMANQGANGATSFTSVQPMTANGTIQVYSELGAYVYGKVNSTKTGVTIYLVFNFGGFDLGGSWQWLVNLNIQLVTIKR